LFVSETEQYFTNIVTLFANCLVTILKSKNQETDRRSFTPAQTKTPDGGLRLLIRYMKSKYALTFAVISSLLLICLVLWRRNASNTIIAVNTPHPGVTALKMDVSKLRKSETIWANRAFLKIEKDDEIQGLLGDLVGRLPLSEKAKLAANRSCWGMLKAYGSGDWYMFQSVRIPIKGYEINTQMVKALKMNAPDKSSETSIEVYHDAWNNTFKKTPLFDQVSLESNAVTVLTLPLIDIKGVAFPQFTTLANQNWMTISPTRFFDYDKIMSNKSNQVQVLRFFFFGKIGNDTRPYMVIFVWNEDDSVWLPWRMTFALVKTPLHNVLAF